jgi:hypothetical protein
MNDPNRVIIAGDWHGNERWAAHVIENIPFLLKDQEKKIILQVGDFGIWPGIDGTRYLSRVEQALLEAHAQLWFIEGNHENYSLLEELRHSRPIDHEGGIWITDHIRWLPRGFRWTWHEQRWLALGGAVSVDRALRKEGFDWFPEEVISEEDKQKVIDEGPADIMLCHDCPSDVNLYLGPPPLSWSMRDVIKSEEHRAFLQKIVDEVAPRYFIHGHYHNAYTKPVAMNHGTVEVTGLNMDGKDTNYFVYDTVNMQWIY